MFSKSFVLLAVLAVVTQSARLDPQLYSLVSNDEGFNNLYQRYIQDEHVEDSEVTYGTYLMKAIANFNKWRLLISDISSVEYRALVAAQNGNTQISSDLPVLVKQYFNILSGSQVVQQGNQQSVSSQSVTQSTSSSSKQESQSSVSSNVQSTSSQNLAMNQNVGIANNDRFDVNNKQVKSVNSQQSESTSSQTTSQSSKSSSITKQESSSMNVNNGQQNVGISTDNPLFKAGNLNQNLNWVNNGGFVGGNKQETAFNSQQSKSSKTLQSSSVSKEESSSLNVNNAQQNVGISNGDQFFNAGNLQSNNVQANSFNSQESKSETSSVNKQVSSVNTVNNVAQGNYGYDAGYDQGYGAIDTESIGKLTENVNTQESESVNNNYVSAYDYGNSNVNNNQIVTSVNNEKHVDEFNHVANSKIFNHLESTVNQYDHAVAAHVVSKPQTPQEKQAALQQSHNAHYSFASTVDNNIEGNYLQQVETRKDGKVFGRYSYDDGNNFVTRYYIADENGFRIVKESVAATKKKGHLNGQVTVNTVNDGVNTEYHITEQDIQRCQTLMKPVPYTNA